MIFLINYIELIPKIIDFGTSLIRDEQFYNKIQEKTNQIELFEQIFGDLNILYYKRYIFDGHEITDDYYFNEQ